MSDYKDSLNLPKTDFPMRANLTKNEPNILRAWQEKDAYREMIEKNADNDSYTLHDGPPYANANIHLGTAMNKVLKDFIVKHRNLSGKKAQYVPGWDCHGLPIEYKVEQLSKESKDDLGVLEVRKRCREYALKWLDIQREEFKRLGVLGKWDDPYITMTPAYEAATAHELANFMGRGSVQRNKKPIYWCPSCETALAEAEVEYGDHVSPSIFVRFPITDAQKLAGKLPQNSEAYILIWTTTPWTIPDNMAVAVHPEFTYALVRENRTLYILAQELVATCATRFGWQEKEIVTTFTGAELEGVIARHPFYDRPSPIVLADYVTLDAGTGCVHTAPGHGREDYETGLRYGLEILSPLDDKARFLPGVKFFAGKNVFEANAPVIEKLASCTHLLGQENISHSYPHCWRCKKPVIFRATTQWFISMQAADLRKKALEAIEKSVRWIPAWGKDRIYNMVAHRPDWCISRQRMWGVPIIALLCQDCGQAWFDADWAHQIADRFAKHPTGANYWFEAELKDIVPEGLSCPHCKGQNWIKEDDILDVWFDSGTSFAAVLEGRKDCSCPADLYLEGTDQHRGWFHSSLLASVGTRDIPPYKSVLTHGFVLDGQGRKMSKSLGNVIAPQQIIEKHGAEILRLWVASENYQEDLRISDEIIKRLVDAYRRIRNTCRFLLGNLNDFAPKTHGVAPEDMLSLDRYMLDFLARWHEKIQTHYEEFEFHKIYQALYNLCVTDLSSFYLDIVKDRLYIYGPNSRERRSAQTVLWQALKVLTLNMAPILSFTAEEVFSHFPATIAKKTSTIFAEPLPVETNTKLWPQERETWEYISLLRQEVTKAIEPVRQSGTLGHSLDSHITLFAPAEILSLLQPHAQDLRFIFIVSKVSLQPIEQAAKQAVATQEIQPSLKILVEHAAGTKCARCWSYSEQIGINPTHADICPRCAEVMAC